MLTGDSSIITFDLQSNSWSPYGHLEHARLGYSIAVNMPLSMCPNSNKKSFLFKQSLPLERLEQNEFLPLEQTTKNSTLTDEEDEGSLNLYDVSSASVCQTNIYYFIKHIISNIKQEFSCGILKTIISKLSRYHNLNRVVFKTIAI